MKRLPWRRAAAIVAAGTLVLAVAGIAFYVGSVIKGVLGAVVGAAIFVVGAWTLTPAVDLLVSWATDGEDD